LTAFFGGTASALIESPLIERGRRRGRRRRRRRREGRRGRRMRRRRPRKKRRGRLTTSLERTSISTS
jgi:hypothetical protein